MSEIKGTPVKFKIGGQADYEGTTKDDNVIYFTTDSDGNHRIYVGDDCYNVTVIETDLDSAVMSTKTVPSTQATKEALNGKVSRCRVVDGLTIPNPINIKNNVEYRYLGITDISGITIKTAASYERDLFYCSIILNSLNSTDSVADFVTVDPTSGTNVRFLNPDVNLSDMDTVELLFFFNGLDICCIAATYKHEEV